MDDLERIGEIQDTVEKMHQALLDNDEPEGIFYVVPHKNRVYSYGWSKGIDLVRILGILEVLKQELIASVIVEGGGTTV